MLKKVEASDFETEVLKNEKPILVDFYADWCGPCKMVGPILEKIGNEQSEFDVAKINVDNAQDIAQKYGVMSIPNMILFKNGEKVGEIVGFRPEDAIVEFVKGNI